MKLPIAILIGTAFALTACNPGPNTNIPGPQRISTAGRPPLDPIGDPGKVAAADFAFALAAREDGQWTAFRSFAASNAVIHTPDGVVDADSFLSGRADPPEAVRWAPDEIWTSCDGSLAVTTGRFTDPDGLVGSYATVWALQDDLRTYKWTYDIGAPDNPQPPAPPPEVEPDEDTIVVSELTSITGHVADCSPAKEDGRHLSISMAEESEMGLSQDRSLVWQWDQFADGTRGVIVHYLRNGELEQVLDLSFPALAQ